MSTRLNRALALAVLSHIALLSLPLAQRFGEDGDRQTPSLSVRLIGGSDSSTPINKSSTVPSPAINPVTTPAIVVATPPLNPSVQAVAAGAAAVSEPPARAGPLLSAKKPVPVVSPPTEPIPVVRHRPATEHPVLKPIEASSTYSIVQDNAAVTSVANSSNRPELNNTGASSTTGNGSEKGVPLVPPLFGLAYLANPKPSYPPMARRRAIEGRVLLRVRVNVEGRPVSTAIEHSSGHRILDMAAVDAVKQWRFVPAHRGDEPVEAYALVPIQFHLNG